MKDEPDRGRISSQVGLGEAGFTGLRVSNLREVYRIPSFRCTQKLHKNFTTLGIFELVSFSP